MIQYTKNVYCTVCNKNLGLKLKYPSELVETDSINDGVVYHDSAFCLECYKILRDQEFMVMTM